MSVLTVVNAIRVPFFGGDREGEPIGIWSANGSVVGDGGGGTAGIQINFRTVGSRASALIYSLEHLNPFLTLAAQNPFRVLTGAMTNTFGGEYRAFSQVEAVATSALLPIERQSQFAGVILGAPTRNEVAAALTVQLETNPGVGETWEVTVAGYYWEARARTAPGGPRRPLQGFFKA